MHPTLTATEQERAKAGCRMEATKATGNLPKIDRMDAQSAYLRDCLIAKGFMREEAHDA